MRASNLFDRPNPIFAVASLTLASLLLPALYWALRLAAADHLSSSNSPRNIRLSTQLAPGNVHYLLRLAELEATDGQDPSATLKQAVQASPLDATVWLQLGLEAEQKGDISTAEQALLRAAQLDRRFRPRWDLASFYVRRNNARQSWYWANQALQIGRPEDFAAVFRLCWSLNPKAEDIWREAIPKIPVALEQYLAFLLAENKLDAAAPVAAQLADLAQTPQVRSVLVYCDAAIVAKRPAPALACWNRLSRRGLLSLAAVEPSAGKFLANGNFEQAPTGLGFDWRLAGIEGISVQYDQTNPHIRVAFSGKQPENCEILSVWTVLQPSRTYRLASRYETDGIPPGSGLAWQIYNAENGAGIMTQTPSLSHQGQTTAETQFRTTERENQLSRLALVYQRAPGTVRIEGSLRLSSVSLEFAP